MEGESSVTRSKIDELHSSYIQGYQMVGESILSRSIIEELHYSDIQGDEREGESGVTRSIIDELDFLIRKEINWMVKKVLLEV